MNFGLPAVDYLVIGIYLVLMLGIGFYFSRFMKGGKDFFIGGNLIPWWVSGISLYMTMFSAWTFTGGASFVYQTSWFGLLYFATWGTSFLIGFLMSAKRWRRTRVTSPVEYIETRFNKSTHLFFSLYLALKVGKIVFENLFHRVNGPGVGQGEKNLFGAPRIHPYGVDVFPC